MAKIKFRPYGKKQAYAWQKQAHEYISSWLARTDRVAETVVVKAARQRYGKSAFTKAELGRFALTVPGSLNAYVTPKLSLARKMQKEMARGYAPLIESSNLQDMIIIFNNGSQIRFHSENQGEGLRGFTVDGVMVIDEGAFIRDDTFYELLLPWIEVHGALTIIVSTPQFKTGFYYENYMDGMSDENPYVKTFDWVIEWDVPISPGTLARKMKMPWRKWLSEFLGQFLDAEGAVFGKFAECLISYPTFEYVPEEVYLGLDFGTGSGKDSTVLTGFNEKGDQLFIWDTNDMTPTAQVEEISRIYHSYDYEVEKWGKVEIKNRVQNFLVEQNGIGKIYIDQLNNSGIAFTPFITTNDSKRELVEDMQVAIQNKEVGLLNDPTQVREYSFYESKTNLITRKVTYGAPAKMHDDRVMASLLAWRAYKMGSSGQYDIIF